MCAVTTIPLSHCISSVLNNPCCNPCCALADYDNLATHVPNLVESSRRPHPTGGIRLFQEGAQTIVGFDFRASLTMDMVESTEEGASRPTIITFDLVDSAMFASFDGEWRVQPYSRVRSRSEGRVIKRNLARPSRARLRGVRDRKVEIVNAETALKVTVNPEVHYCR